MSQNRVSTARRSFRIAALATSIVCFLLSLVMWAWGGRGGSFAAVACLAVGFIMLAIYSTGTWPPRRPPGRR